MLASLPTSGHLPTHRGAADVTLTSPRRRPATPDRIASLTGTRALAALLVIGTHAAYGTGKETQAHGYLGVVFTRLEIGVPIFFVLSGLLLFRPWVTAAATRRTRPLLGHYASHRVRRIMPAYVVAVVLAFAIYQFRSATPDPGHSWTGLLRYLTLTQIYTDNFLLGYAHQGLAQMWSLATEVAFYAALPVVAWVLLEVLCRGQWRPGLLLTGIAALAAVSPLWLIVLTTTDWLPSSAGMWLPGHLAYFAAGMALAVLQGMRVRCHAVVALPLAGISYLIVSTPIAGSGPWAPVMVWEPLAKVALYTAIAALVVAPLVLGPGGGGYARLMSSRPMMWLGGISYELFLLHVIVMDIAMGSVLRWQPFTGSTLILSALTLALTIPIAWLLHRLTQKPPQPVGHVAAASRSTTEDLWSTGNS